MEELGCSTKPSAAPVSDVDLPVASAPVIMVSLPDTQEGPQDVFHTPPEESSLASSDDQRRTLAVDVDVDRCAVNKAVDVDAGTQVSVDLGGFSDGSQFVDLGRDSGLGFSEAQLTQETHAKLVPGCSRGSEGDGLGKIPECHFGDFGVLERELSELGELPVKKLKLSEQNLGFDSSGDCFGVQLQKVEEGMENRDEEKLISDAEAESPCNFGEDLQPQENVLGCEQVPVDASREISMGKNVSPEENFETEVVQLETVTSAGDVNMIEGNKSSDEVVEVSGMRERSDEDQGLRVLPISIGCRLENAANELESREERKKKKCPVFDVLKVLSENNRDDEDNIDDVSLLDAAQLCGITFPRPRWWPDHYNFNNQSQESP